MDTLTEALKLRRSVYKSIKAGFITGENICIDGGRPRNIIYHNDFGWKLAI